MHLIDSNSEELKFNLLETTIGVYKMASLKLEPRTGVLVPLQKIEKGHVGPL